MIILVVGATGALGREVAAQLIAAGHEVRALTHRAWSTEAVQHPNLEIVRGDLIDRATIAGACRGVDGKRQAQLAGGR